MSDILHIDEFIRQTNGLPILDVRSPSEYAKGHIPGAINLPLLNDEERHITGLAYAEHGKTEAVRGALQMVGPKLKNLVDVAQSIAPNGILGIYCFRGGMRSNSMAWLLETAGIRTLLLEGGYKSWRQFALEILQQPKPLMVLTGHTGSGKTEILHTLIEMGEQVIDLEALASHRGSVFGAIGLSNQPSSEHFSNLLAEKWLSIDSTRITFIESESIRIGNIQMIKDFFVHIENAPAICIQATKDERIKRIINEYGHYESHKLINAFERISKRLGDENTRKAICAVEENRLDEAVAIALLHYDSYYQKQLDERAGDHLLTIKTCGAENKAIAKEVIDLTKKYCLTSNF